MQTKPFDLKLCLVSFLTGAFCLLPAVLFMCHQCRRHVETESRLHTEIRVLIRSRDQLQAEQVTICPAVPHYYICRKP